MIISVVAWRVSWGTLLQSKTSALYVQPKRSHLPFPVAKTINLGDSFESCHPILSLNPYEVDYLSDNHHCLQHSYLARITFLHSFSLVGLVKRFSTCKHQVLVHPSGRHLLLSIFGYFSCHHLFHPVGSPSLVALALTSVLTVDGTGNRDMKYAGMLMTTSWRSSPKSAEETL